MLIFALIITLGLHVVDDNCDPTFMPDLGLQSLESVFTSGTIGTKCKFN